MILFHWKFDSGVMIVSDLPKKHLLLGFVFSFAFLLLVYILPFLLFSSVLPQVNKMIDVGVFPNLTFFRCMILRARCAIAWLAPIPVARTLNWFCWTRTFSSVSAITLCTFDLMLRVFSVKPFKPTHNFWLACT
jgi:hypothetical protein